MITSAEPGPFTSPSYNITQTTSTVSAATVTPSPVTPGAGAGYTVNFNVGSRGRLLGGTSTITITFNTSTTVSTTPADYDSTYIIADGNSYLVNTTDSISVSGRAVTLIVPNIVSIGNNEAVSVILNRTGATKPIQNPSSSGDYTLQVRTSVETSNITSNSYTITSASAVTGITNALGNSTVNAESQYTIRFRVQNPITTPSGTITVTFPYNTLIPASIATGSVTIAHDASDPDGVGVSQDPASAVSANPSTRVVTITIPNNIGSTDSVAVRFLASAGIENPSIDGNYTLNVKTTSQNVNGTSASYSLQPNTLTITNFSIVIDPLTPSVNGQFTFGFTTSNYGRLVSGVSKIFLLFDYDVTLPGSPPSTTRVRVNGVAADALEVIPRSTAAVGFYDTLAVTVPTSVTIGNNNAVTVVIDAAAGIQNASWTTPVNYQAYTSVDDPAGDDFSLPVELTHFSVESKTGRVYLNWITASELENAYWMIQRLTLSKDEYEQIVTGELNIDDMSSSFEIIDYIDAKGSVSVETNYTYVDSLVSVGNVYGYRLADVSYSGVITFHEILFQEITAPEAFKLYNNYPNPFNPITTIKYSLPVDANVELRIFNLLGQEVSTLVSDMEKAGFHYVQWNGTNQSGNILASGVYFVYMQATGASTNQQFNQVMKIVFLK